MKIFFRVALPLLFSLAAFGHNMPVEIKKENVIKLMIENGSFDSLEKVSLEKGTFDLSTSEIWYSPLTYLDAYFDSVRSKPRFFNPGDQDYEEFFFYFTYKNTKFIYNCGLRTEELIDDENIDMIKYQISVLDCVLFNVDRKISKDMGDLGELSFTRKTAY
jgi:hypothetical protein